MKNECNVVRDLMPLVIDGVASEESAAYVEAHVTKCPPCAEIYAGMKAELPRLAAEKQQAEAEAASKILKRKRKQRRQKLVLIGLALGVLLVLAVNMAYTMLFQQVIYPVSSGDCSVSLYRSRAGRVLVVYRMSRDDLLCGFSWGGDGETLNIRVCSTLTQVGNRQAEQLYGGWYIEEIGVWAEDGWAATPYRLPRYGKGNVGMELISENEELIIPEPYEAVYVDYSDGPYLIYRKGDSIPLASDALEEYITPGAFATPEERAFQRDFIPEFH